MTDYDTLVGVLDDAIAKMEADPGAYGDQFIKGYRWARYHVREHQLCMTASCECPEGFTYPEKLTGHTWTCADCGAELLVDDVPGRRGGR